MTPSPTSPNKPPSSPRTPWKTILAVVGLVVAVPVLQSQAGWLHRVFNLSKDELNIVSLVLVITALVIAWCWWMFRSRVALRWRIGSLVLLVALGWIASRTVRLVPGGNLGIRRVEFSFWQRELPLTTQSRPVDLTATSADDFPEFRGPGRLGQITDRQLVDWSEQAPELVWNQAIGDGWSAFSAVNGFAVTMEQRLGFECVTCYDVERGGDPLWIYQRPTRHEDLVGLGGVGPRSTPTLHNGKVYVQGATGWVACLDGSTGEAIWTIELDQLLEIPQIEKTNISGLPYTYEDNTLAWGRAASPLIVGDTLVVPGGGPTGGPYTTLLAFDKETGALVWRAGEHMIGYGSPSLGRLLGQPQILLVGENVTGGYDVQTGAPLWEFVRPGGSSSDANCSQVTPVGENQVLLTKGYRSGGELVELTPTSDGIEAKRVWKNNRVLKTKFNSPVIRNGYAYSLSAGYLECTEVATGEQKWICPNRRAGDVEDEFNHGQLLLVGDKLLVMSEDGELYLVAADPQEYRRLGKMTALSGVCWNNLCLHGDFLLLRSDVEAACFRLGVVPTSGAEATPEETAPAGAAPPVDEPPATADQPGSEGESVP